MALQHLVDHERRLVTIFGHGEVLESALESAGRLLADHSLTPDFSLLIILNEAAPPEGDDVLQLVELLRLVMRRFDGRIAFAAPGVGQQTPATLIAMFADDGHARVQAFESEDAAVAWVLDRR